MIHKRTKSSRQSAIDRSKDNESNLGSDKEYSEEVLNIIREAREEALRGETVPLRSLLKGARL